MDYRIDVLDDYESRAFQVDKANDSSVEVVPRIIVPRVIIQAGMPLARWPCDEHVKSPLPSSEQGQLVLRALWALAVQRRAKVSLSGNLVADPKRLS
jgi:hypothetical protein